MGVVGVMPLALALACLLARDAAVDDARTYEDQRLAVVMASEGLVSFAPRDDDVIGFVRIVRHDVFTADDPYPDWLNLAHVMTHEDIVTRELLFAEGGLFERLEETARNLRDMFIFSFVRIVAVRRASDGAVGVLVFTRDLWSLRFEQGIQLTGTSVDRLLLQLTERNVLGRAKVASLRFTMDPSIFALGETYLDRRVWGSGILAQESIDLIFSRQTGALEGSAGGVFVGMPLQSFAQEWGFDATALYDVRIVRQIQDGVILTYDAPSTPDVEEVKRVYGQRAFDVELAGRRQFTTHLAPHDEHGIVHRLAAGVGFSDDFVEPVDESALPNEAAVERDFRADVLPAVRRTLFPFAAYHAFSPKHRVYEDLDTYGVSEAVRLGPSLSVVMGAGSKAIVSSSDTVFASGAAGIALDPLDGLFETAIEAAARFEDGDVVNRVLAARLRYATAPVFLGRFLLRADVSFRRDDITNAFVSLGGDNGLRGYPSRAFFAFGASAAQSTIEWRSLPIDLWSVQLGVAAFYDAGALFSLDDPADLSPEDLAAFGAHHSIGVGVRFLFPQFNRGVYRVDFAVPLDDLGLRVQFSLGDTQAVEHTRAAFDRLAPRR
jgi:hypothetical protein